MDAQFSAFIKKFGARIRSFRQERGWTLEEAEEKGWPNWRHLQKIESGKNITLGTIWRLSKFYKKPLVELFKDS